MQNSNLSNLKSMMNMLKTASNPSAMLNKLAQSNPAFGNAMKMVEQNGGDARAAFYEMAKQNGVDPNQILSVAKKLL